MNFHQSNEGNTISVGAHAQTCLRIHALSPARVSRSPSCARRLYTFAAVRGFQTGPRRDHLSREGNYPPRWIPGRKLVVQTYVPTPQKSGAYGAVEVAFPSTPDEWIGDRWYPYLIRTNPQLPWLPEHVKRRIRDFETVMNSRWPTTQDMRLPGWGRALLKSLGSWRYALGAYDFPGELRLAQKLVRLRQPRLESL